MAQIIQAVAWEVWLILLPLIGALVCFVLPRLAVVFGLLVAAAITVCAVGAGLRLTLHGAYRYNIGGWGAPLGIDLYSDGLSMLMLAASTLVGLGVSVYANIYFAAPRARVFWPLWLFLWAALNALFLSADVFNLYVTLELLGLAAVSLVALAGGLDALRAAIRYLLVSLVGSLAYLLGVALLYHSLGSVDIAILAIRVVPNPAVWTGLGLMAAGLLLKTAIFPLHFWLPAAHANAPAPVSALLSALVVKACFYILLRLWLEIFPQPVPLSGQLLGILGAAAVVWGGIQALRQQRLKLMIAYSTLAQLGYLFLGFALAGPLVWAGIVYLALSHALAKAAMFMAAGNMMICGGSDAIDKLDHVAQRLPLTLTAFGLAGVSSMGLPPSGGFIAKWILLEAALEAGQWWWAAVLILGGLLTGGYVFRVIGHAFKQPAAAPQARPVPVAMEWVPLLLAAGAILLGFLAPGVLPIMHVGDPFAGPGN